MKIDAVREAVLVAKQSAVDLYRSTHRRRLHPEEALTVHPKLYVFKPLWDTKPKE